MCVCIWLQQPGTCRQLSARIMRHAASASTHRSFPTSLSPPLSVPGVMLYFCHVCEEQTEVLVDHQPICLICQSEFVEEVNPGP